MATKNKSSSRARSAPPPKPKQKPPTRTVEVAAVPVTKSPTIQLPPPSSIVVPSCLGFEQTTANRPMPDRLGYHFLEGHINFIFGPSQVNKSILKDAVITDVTNMRHPFLNQPLKPIDGQDQGLVLVYTSEDEPDVIMHRLTSLGAKYGRVKFPTYDQSGIDMGLDLQEPLTFETHLRIYRPRMVVFDVIMDFVGDATITSATKLANIFINLERLAKQYNVCILIVHHSNSSIKQESDIYQGSGAFKNKARNAIFVNKDMLDVVNGCKRRIVHHYKSSYYARQPDISFTLADPDPAKNDVRFIWHATTRQMSLEERIRNNNLSEESRAATANLHAQEDAFLAAQGKTNPALVAANQIVAATATADGKQQPAGFGMGLSREARKRREKREREAAEAAAREAAEKGS